MCAIYKIVQPDATYYLLSTKIYLFHIINNAIIYLLIILKIFSYISTITNIQEIIYLQ